MAGYAWLPIMAMPAGSRSADGHSEIKRWRDGRTSRPVSEGTPIFDGSTPTPSADNVDIGWLQDKTTRPKQ